MTRRGRLRMRARWRADVPSGTAGSDARSAPKLGMDSLGWLHRHSRTSSMRGAGAHYRLCARTRDHGSRPSACRRASDARVTQPTSGSIARSDARIRKLVSRVDAQSCGPPRAALSRVRRHGDAVSGVTLPSAHSITDERADLFHTTRTAILWRGSRRTHLVSRQPPEPIAILALVHARLTTHRRYRADLPTERKADVARIALDLCSGQDYSPALRPSSRTTTGARHPTTRTVHPMSEHISSGVRGDASPVAFSSR
jgi:hypothetical protein